MIEHNRRQWLRTAGAGMASAATATLGGCAVRPFARVFGGRADFQRPFSNQPFVRPIIGPEQVVRVSVGLRPYRPSGFVVRGERMGDKLIIHNYGHGGGGITMSWGSSTLAVRELPDIGDRRATVLGCGVLGLTTAVLLLERGWQVNIVARELPPHTTSDIAGGYWAPTGVFARGGVALTPQFEGQFKQALAVSHQMFDALIGKGYGVNRRENYHLGYFPFNNTNPFYLHDYPEYFPTVVALGPGEHPFQTPYALHHLSMLIEPAILLPRLMNDIRAAGGDIAQRALRDREEILAIDTPVIFNCTGLGAKQLFGDEELTPIRGQVVMLPPDARVDYLTHGGAGNGVENLLYMFPRTDGILLGGTYERGVADLAPDEFTTARILRQHVALFRT